MQRRSLTKLLALGAGGQLIGEDEAQAEAADPDDNKDDNKDDTPTPTGKAVGYTASGRPDAV